MSSAKGEFRAARIVMVATILLAIGVLVIGVLSLWSDFNDRRAERAAATETSELALTERLNGYSGDCLLYTSPSPRDATLSRMPSSA